MASTEFVNRIPFGESLDQDQKRALLFAFYNAVFIALLGLCLTGLFAAYQILFMFIRPMLWAALVGTMLFPFKRRLRDNLKGWLTQLDNEDRPLVVGVVLLPIQWIRTTSEAIYESLFSMTGAFCVVAYVLTFDDVFLRIFIWIDLLHHVTDVAIGFLTQKWVFATCTLYFLGFGAWICLSDKEKLHKKFARALSLPIWIFVLAQASNFFGPFRVVVFIGLTVVLSLTSAGLLGSDISASDSEQPNSDDPDHKPPGGISAGILEQATHAANVKTSVTSDNGPILERSRIDKAITSDSHIQIMVALCLLLFIARHDVFLLFVLIPLVLAGFFKIGEHLGVHEWLFNIGHLVWTSIHEHVNRFLNIVVAGSLRKFVVLLFTSDRMFVSSLVGKVDLISSICVMIGVALVSLLLILFSVVQIHSEVVHLIKLGGNVLSSDVVRQTMNYTQGQIQEQNIDEYIEQGYQEGRKWVSANIRSLAKCDTEGNCERADQLEMQAKLLMDNLYRMWEQRNGDGANQNLTGRTALSTGSAYDWVSQLTSATNLEALKGDIANIITENYETVLTIVHSVWSVLIVNAQLLTAILTTVTMGLLGFGFDILNSFIELIVFCSVVYYLLAYSDEQWAPLKLVNDLSSFLRVRGQSINTSGLNVGEAVESAISDVFVLSTKMAVFYWLYFNFLYSIFDLHVIFIPSLLSALLAAIPIMPPYIVGIFGFVELFLVRGETVAGIAFALASFAPVLFADAAFYREVKGSHPYVTGLAVIGGIYWLGLQGAIIGPIILCCMVALYNVYVEFAKNR
ncbi:transmembrane protein [Ditylenchus destructor]|uniref:Transmembrane protein n=1 Tax=Ditylenchus destructor TaxID=166010 RepID=A0AAD4MPR2_9BILA|nr:transmembrane protein [Ditylenchus destructor]